jgi:hypothetical protein
VSGLGLADAHERLDLAGGKTQAHEVGHGELGEALLVELGLEMLSSQSTGIVRICSVLNIDRSTYKLRMSTSVNFPAGAAAAAVAVEPEADAVAEALIDMTDRTSI